MLLLLKPRLLLLPMQKLLKLLMLLLPKLPMIVLLLLMLKLKPTMLLLLLPRLLLLPNLMKKLLPILMILCPSPRWSQMPPTPSTTAPMSTNRSTHQRPYDDTRTLCTINTVTLI
jgi:hypothetical protein